MNTVSLPKRLGLILLLCCFGVIYSTPSDAQSFTLTNLRFTAWSYDGRWIAGGGDQGYVFVWDATTQQLEFVLEEHTAAICSLAWSHNSRWLASGGCNGKVIIWNIEGRLVYRTHYDSTVAATSVAWNSTDEWLGICYPEVSMTAIHNTSDGNLVWDINRGSPIAFSPDNRRLSFANGDSIALYDYVAFQNERFEDSDNYLLSMDWRPDGAFVAGGGGVQTGSFTVWEAATGAIVIDTYGQHTDTIYSVDWSPDGRYVLTGGRDGKVLVWDAQTWQPVQTFTSPTGSPVTSVSWGADSRSFVFVDESANLHIEHVGETAIIPPGGDPVCPGGGGVWVWENGFPIFICQPNWE